MISVTISRRSAFIIVLALILLVPAVAFAGSVFDDVDDTDTHIDGITFMKDSGVSVGCDASNNYCPEDTVSRAQMGTFMYRLSGNDPATDPSVNAAQLGGYAASDLIRSAGVNSGGGGIFLALGVAADSTTSVMSVGIDAPVDGVLLVNASANLYCQGLLTTCNDSTGNTYVNVDGDQFSRQYFAIEGADSALNAAAWNASNTAYVPVTAGAHTVALDIQNQASSAGSVYFWSGGLNVLFVPFGSDGSTPSGLAVPAATDVVQGG